ncbi:aldo/keto reductase [Microbacterium sp. ISL-59]|uniref:aldo/keto reductase n=1 Tax=Microbacterium sp. ISL-59 TaxID=2819159 RepID=UPI001BEB06D3|nr:aldo/keto reductase [Microbacterium sp. ISL-59]MBT2495051.1 aldo/keto reductase [Microbacterium sp. ISL-59]
MIPVRAHRGLDISILGMGCAQLGNLGSVLTDEEAEASVRAAWDAGIRYFDTAPHYGLGLSERRLGRALAAYPRDEYVLSTKVGRLLVPSPETAHLRDLDNLFDVPSDVRRVYDLSRDGILRSVEASLERLGLDRVDVVYMHDPDAHFDAARTTGAQTLSALRDEGVIGAYGAGMNQAGMLADLIEQTDTDIVMCAGRLTLLEQGASVRMLRLARERGVAVVAAAVYNSGLLARDSVPDRVSYDYADAPQDIVERARDIEQICRAHGTTLPSAAVQYPLRMPQVVSAVVGMRGVQQVTEAVARATASIPESLWTALEHAGHILSPESI